MPDSITRAAPGAAPTTGRIAIIGVAGRFPGAPDVETLWRNLLAGREGILRYTREELLAEGVSPADLDDPRFVPAGAPLDGLDLFDAGFFGMSPAEAAALDPQQRLFLECAWEALEDAGHTPEGLAHEIGVFAGGSLSLYAAEGGPRRDAGGGALARIPGLEELLANDKDYLAARAAHRLDLRGPAVGVQTACSSSLVAVWMACQALLSFQCDMALAGGVTARVPHRTGYLTGGNRIGPPDGRTRPFDARGAGPVFGNGAGVVALRRLEDALAAGDAIRAVILGGAVLNDGAARAGFAAPGVEGQARCVALAQAVAGVAPEGIGYVEAHGTGTALGDPIEVAALTQAFRAGGARRRGFCALGSIKSNIGHLESAAGVAGLIKATLTLEREAIPATLHFTAPNPEIDFAASPFFVQDRLAPWPRDPAAAGPRRAGVSSVGLGGTNAHVVLEEAPPPPAMGHAPLPARPHHPLVLSARSPAALARAAERLAARLEEAAPAPDPADLSHTLRRGRRAFPHRLALGAADAAEAAAALRAGAFARGAAPEDGAPRRVAMLFPGGGAQHAGMGRGLHAAEPAFREALDRCALLLRPHLGYDLRERMLDPSAAPLEDPQAALSALFAHEWAAARLWEAWGVRPAAVVGHSLGEYAAAAVAGVLPLEDALALVARRARLMEALPRPGAMTVLPLPEAEACVLLAEAGAAGAGRLDLAAVNAPDLCVAAGPEAAVAVLEALLVARGQEARRLRIAVASHSAEVEPMLAEFRGFLGTLRLNAPTLPLASNLTGRWLTAEEATDPGYWARHLRHTVRFAEGLGLVLREAEGALALLEVGPGSTLATLARRHPDCGAARAIATTAPHPAERRPETQHAVAAAGALWAAGAAVDWDGFDRDRPPARRVPLPTYPFERRRHWLRPAPAAAAAAPATAGIEDWFLAPSWRRLPPLPGPAAPEPGPWLVFLDRCGTGAALAAALREAGARIATVAEAPAGGPAFARLGADAFALDPGSVEGHAALLAALREAEMAPRRVAHLWNATARADAGDLRRALDSPAALLAALEERPCTVDLVSTGLHEVTGEEAALHPLKAALLGPLRAASREMPWLAVRGLDLPGDAAHWAGAPAAARHLLAALALPEAPPVRALRGAHAWAEAFEPLRLPPLPPDAPHPLLRERGTYWITGGTGGVGLALAEALAARCRARLVLTGRGAPEEGDAPPELAAALARIAAQGGEALVLRADATDRMAMARTAEQAIARFGRIHGAVHAAGTVAAMPLSARDPAAAAALLAPKLAGAEALEAVCDPLGLDFVAYCSSVQAVTCPPGLADYAAANAVLDARARARGRAGRRTLSIGWAGWTGAGLAARLWAGLPEERRAVLAWAGEGPRIAPAEGGEAFLRALATAAGPSLPHLLVAPGGLAPAHPAQAEPPMPVEEEPAPEAAPEDAPTDPIQRAVAAIWCRVLGLPRIGPRDDFFALGGHSLLGTRVLAAVGAEFGVALPLRALFENPTVAALAAHLATAMHPAEAAPAAAAAEEEELSW